MNAEHEWNVKSNRQEHDRYDDQLTFADEATIREATDEREQIIEKLGNHVAWGYKRSKADVNNLSPGCRHCGQGDWSCLFINGLCNASCFYCPAPQDREDTPTTQTVDFPDVEDYIRYIRKFGYKGVSISGGEPFLTFDKTLHFITRIRHELKEDVYLWLYTNGILADDQKIMALKEAGLNEIRFDIGATGYRTDKVEMALKYMDVVTIEIPAVPEEYERLKQLLHHFDRIGLSHLNLHQIRCTPHNYSRLVKRGYTFLHGPQITVLDSELTALRLMDYAHDAGIRVPLNYCSSVYKYRYQRKAARKRYAPFISNHYEEVTETGMIRTMAVEGEPEKIQSLVASLAEKDIDHQAYHKPDSTGKLYFKEEAWPWLNFEGLTLKVSYSRAFMLPGISYRNMFKEIMISPGKKIVIERTPLVKDLPLKGDEIYWFEQCFISRSVSERDMEQMTMKPQEIENTPTSGFVRENLARLFEYERISYGLQDYY